MVTSGRRQYGLPQAVYLCVVAPLGHFVALKLVLELVLSGNGIVGGGSVGSGVIVEVCV